MERGTSSSKLSTFLSIERACQAYPLILSCPLGSYDLRGTQTEASDYLLSSLGSGQVLIWTAGPRTESKDVSTLKEPPVYKTVGCPCQLRQAVG